MQALSVLDAICCAQQGAGDWGAAASSGVAPTDDQHESLDFGIVSLDSCGLCHLGCTPVALAPLALALESFPNVFASSLSAARIEHDPTPPLRPPRTALA